MKKHIKKQTSFKKKPFKSTKPIKKRSLKSTEPIKKQPFKPIKPKKEIPSISEILRTLEKNSDLERKKGMEQFGIDTRFALGVKIPTLRSIAKGIGKDHSLAKQLWKTRIHEARILASIIAPPEEVTYKQVDKWVKNFNSWDLCDQCCMNLFSKLEFAFKKAIELTEREPEFERRAGFSLMACLAVHNKSENNAIFLTFFPAIEAHSSDSRNFVKKSVNWALRQIGKRNKSLNTAAILLAEKILEIDSKTAKWIASDAIKELKTKSF